MPSRLSLAFGATILAALLLARPAAADDGSAPGRADVAEVSASSASASLVSPYRPVGDGATLSTGKLVGLIVACFVPAVVLLVREREPARERARAR